PRSAPPVDAEEGDEDLLIFAEARSAWFNGARAAQGQWTSPMDEGWRAAEQAANPSVGDLTRSGLPRRVPHANLVPGSPPSDGHRPLRVVRDPSRIAANTSGYFNGWRKGQEVGGYPLGNRVSSKGGGAWEFSRDDRLSGGAAPPRRAAAGSPPGRHRRRAGPVAARPAGGTTPFS